MNKTTKGFAVIIPVRNGAAWLPEFFSALRRQTVTADEIIVADTMSGDDSATICEHFGAQVIEVAEQSFDHGGTRSRLARMARSDLLVFFTQDAILADRDSLEKLLVPLENDSTVAVSYGRQLPRRDATPVAAHLRTFNYPQKSEVRSYDDRRQKGLRTIFCSNSFAAYRRKPLAEVDYFKNGLIFGEDTCTLGKLLRNGYKVAYVSDAAVYHSHNYTIGEEFRRSFDIGVLHQSEKWLLETYGLAEGIGAEYVRSLATALASQGRYFWLLDCVFRTASKIVGYKLGRRYQLLPTRLRTLLSMHRDWWRGQTGK